MESTTSRNNKVYDLTTIETFSWMRFPLIMGVVIAHCNLEALLENWYDSIPVLPTWLTFIFNKAYIYIFPARVPTLFFISGYFFFRGTDAYNKSFYKRKYERRIHSLLIPYILWNSIALLLIWIRHTMQFHSNVTEGVSPSILDYLSGFWDFTYNKGFTANAPLWFMRDLIVVSFYAPLLRYILQKNYWIPTLTLMAVAHISGIEIPISGCNIEAFFFFSIGATLAIHKTDSTRIPHYIGITSLLLYFPISYFLLGLSEQWWYVIMATIAIFIKSIAIIYVVSQLFQKEILSPTPLLTKNSFFLFALHGIIIGPIIKILYILADSNNPYVLLGIFIAAPAITIAIAFTLRNILQHYFPRLGNLLSGNR